jgi:hypothetical protein
MEDLLVLEAAAVRVPEREMLTPETSSRRSMVGIALTVEITTVARTKRAE